MDIPIIQGIYSDANSNFTQSLPVNREPVVLDTGISKGFLRPSVGVVPLGVGPGPDRGSIEWNGVCYRVMGSSLVTVAPGGGVTVLGDVGTGGPCAFDYSFERLGINSGNRLYYWTPNPSLAGAGLVQVTDPDLGPVFDVVWQGGYFITTDGISIVTTDIDNPFSVNPLHYGSAELDPDPVVALVKVRGELYALNRYTIQAFQNTGGNGFPYSLVDGADIPIGCIGTRARCSYLQSFAFVGGSRNQPIGVYLAGGGTAEKLSSRTIDDVLAKLTPDEQRQIELESIFAGDEWRLVMHTPYLSYVFYAAASKVAGVKIWTILGSGVTGLETYRPRHAVQVYGDWIVGDAGGNIGTLSQSLNTQWGDVIGWRFDVALLYNDDKRMIVNSVELVGMMGEAPFGLDPQVFLSFTMDGRTWGQERACSAGEAGNRANNLQWRPGRRINSWGTMRFRGADQGMATFATCNVSVEPLA